MHEQSRLYDELPADAGGDETKGTPVEEGPTGSGEPGEGDGGMPFEEAFSRLEHIVQRLEGGQASLEESLQLFEEGVKLARLCRNRLDRAERRIRVLVDGEEGEGERRIAAGLEAEVIGDGPR